MLAGFLPSIYAVFCMYFAGVYPLLELTWESSAELPGNMALVKFGVARTAALLMLGLGVSTLAQGLTQHWVS